MKRQWGSRRDTREREDRSPEMLAQVYCYSPETSQESHLPSNVPVDSVFNDPSTDCVVRYCKLVKYSVSAQL